MYTHGCPAFLLRIMVNRRAGKGTRREQVLCGGWSASGKTRGFGVRGEARLGGILVKPNNAERWFAMGCERPFQRLMAKMADGTVRVRGARMVMKDAAHRSDHHEQAQ